ncbi:hypothetical protein KAM622c_11820 [Klebsiella quasipneumoniae subsp. quasipneumoniae]|nr:hypothetical protein KAM622c_11820 [Klebsiella quasipneumoniae subsp. quasipneumoniae]
MAWRARNSRLGKSNRLYNIKEADEQEVEILDSLLIDRIKDKDFNDLWLGTQKKLPACFECRF